MIKQEVQEVITDGSNTQVICNDAIYEKQLNGSAMKALNKHMERFMQLSIADKELMLTQIRKLLKE